MAKRRKNGEGMIRKRSDGRWEGRVVVGYDDKGLPITKNVLAHTKIECAEKLEKLKEEYTDRRVRGASRICCLGIGSTSGTRTTPSQPSDR